MNETEETIINVQPNVILMDNIEYIMENITHFEMPTRIEEVFTASELRCGRESGSSFSFMDLSQANIRKEDDAAEVDESKRTIPTVEINDSDEDVIFVAEYNNIRDQNSTEVPSLVPFPCYISRSDTSSSSTSSDASPGAPAQNKPRRNPTRFARNRKYKKKSSDYITEEDLNVLIASDEENSCTDVVEEAIPEVKEVRQKKVIVNNWPAEGLHERPEYNEQTEEIEKFDFSIRQIQNIVKKVKPEKPKKLKAQKKKYVSKKYTYRKNKNKKINKKKEVEMAPFEELTDLINDTFFHLSVTFMETLVKTKGICSHKCHATMMDDPEFKLEEGENCHSRCLSNYDELWMNQSQLFSLGNEGVDFKETYNGLKKKFELAQNCK